MMRNSPLRLSDVALSEQIALPSDEVHVWRVSLEPSEGNNSRLAEFLYRDERERADRFKRVPDRDAFVTCRGALRLILNRYTGEDPRMFRFAYGPWGKPRIEGGEGSFRFSVSHSHGAGVVALTRGREVGVDVERIRPLPDAEEIAERYFSRREVSQFMKLPKDHRLKVFYHCWTRKEAFAKALGKGLSLPFDQFSVSLIPGEPAELVEVLWDREEAMRWRVFDLPETQLPSQGEYAGAIAAEGRDWRLRYFTFELKPGGLDACVWNGKPCLTTRELRPYRA